MDVNGASLNATDARKQIQASAYVGLARVADAAGDTQQARDVLTTASRLYREIGDVERAELMAAQKSQLARDGDLAPIAKAASSGVYAALLHKSQHAQRARLIWPKI